MHNAPHESRTNPDWVPWRTAWQRALYGPDGFYRHQRPGDHFRTSVHTSPLFASAVARLVHEHDLGSVTDLGAGAGELLVQLRDMRPDLSLTGVELRPRPAGLPDSIAWRGTMPSRIDGLLIANEVLDNIPCEVVERDAAGDVRLVEVQPGTGAERLGCTAPNDVVEWLSRWWPLTEPGQRAEVGLSRDRRWLEISRRVHSGLCVAVDYGHVRAHRPPAATLSSYRDGRQTAVTLDGAHDVTAAVAFDSLASATRGRLRTQRDVLRGLGFLGSRPPLALADRDPVGYARELARASQVAELTASPGLGDFWWLMSVVKP